MYKIEFKLKQHTTIIHFQHDQDGATLRATEVKPKLDKFIVAKYEGRANMPSDCFIKDKDALNYKLLFISSTKKVFYDRSLNKKELEPSYKNNTFFGNLGSKEETENTNKHFVIDENNISTKVIFPSKKMEALFTKEIIVEFFQKHNFGTRNNKGNGSFTVESFSNDTNVYSENLDYLKGCYYFDVKGINYEKLFYAIDYFYKYLKSGINFNREYNKSGLLNFLATLPGNITWEKALIKRTFIPGLPIKEYSATKKELFARALLGLPGSFTYKQTRTKKGIDKSYNLSNDITIEVDYDKNKEIERISSPLIFKPITVKGIFRVFILCPDAIVNLNASNKKIYLKAKMEFVSEFVKDRMGNIRPKFNGMPMLITKSVYLKDIVPDFLNNDELFQNLIDDFYDFQDNMPNHEFNNNRNKLKDLEKKLLNQQSTLKSFFTKFNRTFFLEIPDSLDVNALMKFFIESEIKNTFTCNEDKFKIAVHA